MRVLWHPLSAGKSWAAHIACEEMAKAGQRTILFRKGGYVVFEPDGSGGFTSREMGTSEAQESDALSDSESDGL